jgi:hypothetical protein
MSENKFSINRYILQGWFWIEYSLCIVLNSIFKELNVEFRCLTHRKWNHYSNTFSCHKTPEVKDCVFFPLLNLVKQFKIIIFSVTVSGNCYLPFQFSFPSTLFLCTINVVVCFKGCYNLSDSIKLIYTFRIVLVYDFIFFMFLFFHSNEAKSLQWEMKIVKEN